MVTTRQLGTMARLAAPTLDRSSGIAPPIPSKNRTVMAAKFSATTQLLAPSEALWVSKQGCTIAYHRW
jgi:hypothetical protein